MEKVGRYEVKNALGRGGMATVYQAYDPLFKRDVAVKVLPREFLHDPEFLKRFKREAQTIAALEHPAIVPVYDYGDADGQPYLVMRLMTGGTLTQRLEARVLPIEEIGRIIGRLAPALDSAHSMGIIHRDLKPDNILFDQWEEPYISDFGIAKLMQGSRTALTATGGVVGTPAYMSPEQVRAVEKIDGRSDIYALGVMLFEMMTGQPPYQADTPIGLAFAHVNEPVPRIFEANPDLPPTYQSVIDQAMAKERDARTPTAQALATSVQSLIQSQDSLPSEGSAGVEIPRRAETSPGAESPLSVEPAGPSPHELQPEKSAPSAGRGRLPPWGWGIMGILALALIGLVVKGGFGDGSQNETPAPGIVGESRAEPEEVVLAATETPQKIATEEASSTPLASSATPSPRPTDTLEPSATAMSIPTPMPTPTTAPFDPDGPPAGALHDTWTRPSDRMVMVYVPAGTFMMGSDVSDTQADPDESPQHLVSLDSFWIDRTEVTNAQYALCVAAGECGPAPFASDSGFNGQEYPVIGISWFDATGYCAWSNAQLPTEAQWEYAAQGPSRNIYPWGTLFDGTMVNFCDANCARDWRDPDYNDRYAWTSPVGSYPTGGSWVGALDMAGNVYEWINDWYDGQYYLVSPSEDPSGPVTGAVRVLRGGSWYSSPQFVRVSFRYHAAPDLRDLDPPDFRLGIGFRCAATITGSD